uniref:Transmembrane protein n=1 Tax=Meloidogyne incognita TaxID=6306 RepID=A0A914N1V6_MELIC
MMIVNTNNKKAMSIVTLSIVVLLLLIEHVNSKEMSINVDLKDEVSKDKTPQKEEEKLENKAPVDHNYQAESVKTDDKGLKTALAVVGIDIVICLICSCCCCACCAALLYFLVIRRRQQPPPPPPPYRE